MQAGALVGPDLLADYEKIAEDAAEEIANTLPPLSRKADRTEFSELMGVTDPAVLDFFLANANNRAIEIAQGIEENDRSVPGVLQAMAIWREQVAKVRAQERKSGQEALDLLRENGDDGRLEILVEGTLAVSQAIATIEAGQVVYRCRRPLHNPESIAAGYGPHCQKG